MSHKEKGKYVCVVHCNTKLKWHVEMWKLVTFSTPTFAATTEVNDVQSKKQELMVSLLAEIFASKFLLLSVAQFNVWLNFQDQEDFVIKPTKVIPPLDTSNWPLLLKVSENTWWPSTCWSCILQCYFSCRTTTGWLSALATTLPWSPDALLWKDPSKTTSIMASSIWTSLPTLPHTR